mmetsp:Transcript_67239/g.149147  ORF Transcript_67239/g.149147 Transcript_67239/m.149147 type:complete len:86 (-) Transcript_67239:6-263(-)
MPSKKKVSTSAEKGSYQHHPRPPVPPREPVWGKASGVEPNAECRVSFAFHHEVLWALALNLQALLLELAGHQQSCRKRKFLRQET